MPTVPCWWCESKVALEDLTERLSTAICTDVGLTARSYRSARMTVEIVCRLGCPSAFTCIHCATRFNLIATCCAYRFGRRVASQYATCPRKENPPTQRDQQAI